MSREHDGYRTTLEDILSFTEGARLLTCRKAAEYLGVDPRTVKKIFGVGKDGIAATELARKLCHL